MVMVGLTISMHFQQFADLNFQKFSGGAPLRALCLWHLHQAYHSNIIFVPVAEVSTPLWKILATDLKLHDQFCTKVLEITTSFKKNKWNKQSASIVWLLRRLVVIYALGLENLRGVKWTNNKLLIKRQTTLFLSHCWCWFHFWSWRRWSCL